MLQDVVFANAQNSQAPAVRFVGIKQHVNSVFALQAMVESAVSGKGPISQPVNLGGSAVEKTSSSLLWPSVRRSSASFSRLSRLTLYSKAALSEARERGG